MDKVFQHATLQAELNEISAQKHPMLRGVYVMPREDAMLVWEGAVFVDQGTLLPLPPPPPPTPTCPFAPAKARSYQIERNIAGGAETGF